jgi:hypothetical protein
MNVALSPNVSGRAMIRINSMRKINNADAQLGIPVKNDFFLLVVIIQIILIIIYCKLHQQTTKDK